MGNWKGKSEDIAAFCPMNTYYRDHQILRHTQVKKDKSIEGLISPAFIEVPDVYLLITISVSYSYRRSATHPSQNPPTPASPPAAHP